MTEKERHGMTKTFSPEYIEQAHKATIHHENEILDSTLCTCFYCGHQFDPRTEVDLEWLDETSKKGKTFACPMCHIDCIIGDASNFPITDPQFILACTEAWFGGYSRISDGKPVEKVQMRHIEVD